MKNRLNKSALITGASSGIGEAYARLLASLGYDLIITARRREQLEALASELKDKSGVDVSVMAGNLCNENDLSSLEETARRAVNLTVLINNAGFGTLGHFADVDIDKTLNMIAVHVTAPTRLIKAALPGMIARHEGNIINVSSAAPFLPVAGNVNYNGTKAYLIAFSECLQLEVRKAGINVQAFCPGFTRTGFHSVDEFKEVDFSTIPDFMWMPAEKAVRLSWQARNRRQVVFIPGLVNRLTCAVFRGLFTYIAGKRSAIPPSRR